MNRKLLENLHAEYRTKHQEILQMYGEQDGFVLRGKLWWDYYKDLIATVLVKIDSNAFSAADASAFYKEFGFGPKLYGITFVENGIERISKAIRYLADPSIPGEKKIAALNESPDGDLFIKGVGINFITLFLTTQFPERYAQWNVQTDGALKILGVYPRRDKGEPKSSYYRKINDVCLQVGLTIGEKFLPRVDNFLFCLNKGYIGGGSLQVGVAEKEAQKIESAEEAPMKETEAGKHLEVMYYLVKIGIKKGYDVWVAPNDKNKKYKEEGFSTLCLKNLPEFTQPATLTIAKYIDVIWFKKNCSFPVRFFEIEHSTSVYSGLLRLNDVKIDYPISKASIVIPKEREELFKTQIGRRTFQHSELAEVCDYLVYEDVKEWYKAADVDSRFS